MELYLHSLYMHSWHVAVYIRDIYEKHLSDSRTAMPQTVCEASATVGVACCGDVIGTEQWRLVGIS